MKNLSFLNASPMINATNSASKPSVQLRVNDSTDSFHQKFTHQLNQEPNNAYKAKVPSPNQNGSSQMKSSDAGAVKKAKNEESDGKAAIANAEPAPVGIRKTGHLGKPIPELDPDKSQALNEEASSVVAVDGSTLPVSSAVDLSVYIASLIPVSNQPSNPAIVSDAQMAQSFAKEVTGLSTGRMQSDTEFIDPAAGARADLDVDALAKQAITDVGSAIVGNKPTPHFIGVGEGGDFESAMSSSLLQSAVSKDGGQDATNDMINPSVFSGKVEPASVSAVVAAGAQNIISSYPGREGWDKSIGQKIVWMVGANEQTASLTLNPPDLGPLQVVIQVHNDQTDATFSSDSKEVRQALEDGMANLRDILKDAGISLGQTNINQRSSQQQPQADTAPYQQAAGSPQQNHLLAPGTTIKTGLGLVDTFA